MRLTQFIPALLLGGLFGSFTQSADAVTTFLGTRIYLTILNTNIKYPLFSKEFKEADGIISVGGTKEIWLDDNQKTIGLRLSRERIRPNGSGLGLSLTYWRSSFSNTSFLYRKRGAQNFIAKYRNPTHTYLFLDLNGIYIAWESGNKALGFYSLFSLIGDREQYSIIDTSSWVTIRPNGISVPITKTKLACASALESAAASTSTASSLSGSKNAGLSANASVTNEHSAPVVFMKEADRKRYTYPLILSVWRSASKPISKIPPGHLIPKASSGSRS